MKILGIETSCDETAASIVEDGHKVLTNVVVSQIDIFAAYGGVIPEVASRSHLEAIMPVIHDAFKNPNGPDYTWDDIDAIAVTHTPGLLGSLLVGTLAARTLAILHDKPLYAVHHLKSHVYANWLENKTQKIWPKMDTPTHPEFPVLALVVSGGHTQILYMPAHNSFEIIGTTRDDAIGECFDKVAKILGLPYPGGPAIAKAAMGKITLTEGSTITISPGDPYKYKFPHPKIDGLDFSFSGLKTAVLREVQKAVGKPISFPSHELKNLLTPEQIADFAASFQNTALEILIEKLAAARKLYPKTRSFAIAGGVSANHDLREKLYSCHTHSNLQNPETGEYEFKHNDYLSIRLGRPVFFPDPKYSGDNGAMVAAAAYYEINSGVQPTDPYSLDISPRSNIR